jgi:hypothetical protein
MISSGVKRRAAVGGVYAKIHPLIAAIACEREHGRCLSVTGALVCDLR